MPKQNEKKSSSSANLSSPKPSKKKRPHPYSSSSTPPPVKQVLKDVGLPANLNVTDQSVAEQKNRNKPKRRAPDARRRIISGTRWSTASSPVPVSTASDTPKGPERPEEVKSAVGLGTGGEHQWRQPAEKAGDKSPPQRFSIPKNKGPNKLPIADAGHSHSFSQIPGNLYPNKLPTSETSSTNCQLPFAPDPRLDARKPSNIYFPLGQDSSTNFQPSFAPDPRLETRSFLPAFAPDPRLAVQNPSSIYYPLGNQGSSGNYQSAFAPNPQFGAPGPSTIYHSPMTRALSNSYFHQSTYFKPNCFETHQRLPSSFTIQNPFESYEASQERSLPTFFPFERAFTHLRSSSSEIPGISQSPYTQAHTHFENMRQPVSNLAQFYQALLDRDCSSWIAPADRGWGPGPRMTYNPALYMNPFVQPPPQIPRFSNPRGPHFADNRNAFGSNMNH